MELVQVSVSAVVVFNGDVSVQEVSMWLKKGNFDWLLLNNGITYVQMQVKDDFLPLSYACTSGYDPKVKWCVFPPFILNDF